MDPIFKQMSIIEDSQRLQNLTKSLNLDDFDKLSNDVYAAFYPVAVDFARLQDHMHMQESVYYRYGLDRVSFDQSVFRTLKGIACHMAALPQAFEAYCLLKSQLFLEQNDFIDDIIQRVEVGTTNCKSREKVERLMMVGLLIREIYDAIL